MVEWLMLGLRDPGAKHHALDEPCVMYIVNKVPWNALGEEMSLDGESEDEEVARLQQRVVSNHLDHHSWLLGTLGSDSFSDDGQTSDDSDEYHLGVDDEFAILFDDESTDQEDIDIESSDDDL